MSKSEIKKLNQELQEQFGLADFFSKKDKVEITEKEHTILIVHDGTPAFFQHAGKLVPMLKLILKQNFLKTITIDMGAVKFVASGADIMRPGIVAWDADIKEHELVAIQDETHHKTLAIGVLLVADLSTIETGKVVKNIHYVGDKLWST